MNMYVCIAVQFYVRSVFFCNFSIQVNLL